MKPTPLSPWFIIMRVLDDGTISGDYLAPEWFREAELEDEQWTNDRTEARLYTSVHTVYRVARAVGGYAVLIADEEALKEYRPRGM